MRLVCACVYACCACVEYITLVLQCRKWLMYSAGPAESEVAVCMEEPQKGLRSEISRMVCLGEGLRG